MMLRITLVAISVLITCCAWGMAAELLTADDAGVKLALSRANEGHVDESLPWIIEALQRDAAHPDRVALHRQRLAWLLQTYAMKARGEKAPAKVEANDTQDGEAKSEQNKPKQAQPKAKVPPVAGRPVWNGLGFVTPIRYSTSNELDHAAISPDGRWVMAVEKDLTELVAQGVGGLLWDLQNPEAPPRVIETRAFSVESSTICIPDHVTFSPDSKRVAISYRSFSAHHGSSVQVWDCATARPVSPPLRIPYFSKALEFSPDGIRICAGWGNSCGIVADVSGNIFGAQVWEIATGTAVTGQIDQSAAVSVVRFSPDGRQVVIGTIAGDVTVWDLVGNKLAGPGFSQPGRVNDALFLSDNRRVVVASGDPFPKQGEVSVWDSSMGKRVGKRLHSGDECVKLHVDPKEQQLYFRIANTADCFRVCNLNDNQRISDAMPIWPDRYYAFSPATRQIFVQLKEEQGELRDVKTGETLSPQFPAPRRSIAPIPETALFSPNGQRLVCWSQHALIVHFIPSLTWPVEDYGDLVVVLTGQQVRDDKLVAVATDAIKAAGDRLVKKYPAAFTVRPALPPQKVRHQRVELSAKIADAMAASRTSTGERTEELTTAAKETLREIVQQHPDAFDAWMALGSLCEAYRNWDEAIEAYGTILAKQPANHDALLRRGMVYDSQNRFEPSRIDLQAALDLQPIDWTVHFYLGNNDIEMGHWQRALELLNKADEIATRVGDNKPIQIIEHNYPFIFRSRGRCQALLGEWNKAAEDYSKAVELHPERAVFRKELSLIHCKLNELDKAREQCEKLLGTLKEDSELGTVDMIVWQCTMRPGLLKDYAPAIQAIERVIQERPDEWWYHETLGWLFLRSGQPARAVTEFDKVVKSHPEGGNLPSWTGLAVAHQKLMQREQADKYLKLARAELKRLNDAAKPNQPNWVARLEREQFQADLDLAFPNQKP